MAIPKVGECLEEMRDEDHGRVRPDLPADDRGVPCNPADSTGMQTGQATEGGSSAPLVVGTAYGFGCPRCAVIYPLLHGGGVLMMGAREPSQNFCVGLSLALILLTPPRGGGAGPAGFGKP